MLRPFMEKNIDEIKIAVVGAGSWGTALANLLALKNYAVDLWVFERDVKDQIESRRENRVFLPGIQLSPNIRPTGDIARVVAGKDIVVVVVPSHCMRAVAQKMAPHLSPASIVVSASKGIENNSHLTMTGVLKDVLGHLEADGFTVLSGPSFAKEVARHLPTAVTVASRDLGVAALVQHVLATPYFRVYTHQDTIGVELGGSVKNVIAIAAGIIDGLGLGLNTRAALITRGQTEIRRLGVKLGADPRTFTGLAGMGDLILTCTGDLSRNHMVGREIGAGRHLKEILSDMRMVAEGVRNAASVYHLSRRIGVEMPICHQVHHVLCGDTAPQDALFRLMTRDLKKELDEQ